MPFCTKDYHPATSHPCLYPRLTPGMKRKRDHEPEYLASFWHWYLIREFSGPAPARKVRILEDLTTTAETEPAIFSSLLVRHVADLASKPKPQRKGVRFRMTSETTAPDVEQEVAVTTATYFRTKAPTAAWIKGEGPSQVDNKGMGMTTYEIGGQLKEGDKSLFLVSSGGEIVEVEKVIGRNMQRVMDEAWLNAKDLGAEWTRGREGEKWCNREDDLPWAKVE